jgi:hypothetical protein
VKVLEDRGINVNELPRTILRRTPMGPFTGPFFFCLICNFLNFERPVSQEEG